MKRISKVTMQSVKWCNICGADTVVYTVVDNAPLCNDCVPQEQLKLIKKIVNENKMIQSILDSAGNKKNDSQQESNLF